MKTTKKLLTLLLALLLILSYFPAGALAIDGNDELNFTMDPTDPEYPNLEGRDDITWNPTTKTLTLTDYDIRPNQTSISLPSGSSVVLVGESTLLAADYVGILGVGQLNIAGSGSLNIWGAQVGVHTYGGLNISGVTLEVVNDNLAIMGLYSETGPILIEDGNVRIENYIHGISAGNIIATSSLNGLVPVNPDITIQNSRINFLMNVEHDGAVAIASPTGNISILDSDLGIYGYTQGIKAGYDGGYFYPTSLDEYTLKPYEAYYGNVLVDGSEVTMDAYYYEWRYGDVGIGTPEGNITLTDSLVDIINFDIGLDCGYNSYRPKEIVEEPILPEGNIAIYGTELYVSGRDYYASDRSLKAMFQIGMVTNNGDISIGDSHVEIDHVHSAVGTGVANHGRLTVDNSYVEANVYPDEFANDQVFVAMVSVPYFVEDVIDYHISLVDCYVLVPEGGTVERSTESSQAALKVSDAYVYDYIYPSTEGQIIIAPYPIVSFETNGAGTVADQSVAPGETAAEPTEPSKTGYEFGGWFIDDVTFVEAWNFVEDLVEEDITLYAKWTKVPQTIEYVETDTTTKVEATGLEGNVNIPEKEDTNIKDITVFVSAKKVELSPAIKDKVLTSLAGKGYELLGAFDIELFKRITTYGEQTTELAIDNEDITGNIAVWIPLSDAQTAQKNLAIAYIDDAGVVIIIKGSVQTKGDAAYFVFETDHFSTYALVELTVEPNPPTGFGEKGLETQSGGNDPGNPLIPVAGIGLSGLALVLTVRRRKIVK